MKPRSEEVQGHNPEDIAKRRFHATRCAWTTNGRGCLLTGTRSNDTGGFTAADGTVRPPKAMCAYHADAISAGHGAGDSRDFEAWLEQYRQTFPPSTYGHNDFTRYEPETTWLALIGSENLPARNHGKPADANKPATGAQRAIAMAKVKAMLEGKHA